MRCLKVFPGHSFPWKCTEKTFSFTLPFFKKTFYTLPHWHVKVKTSPSFSNQLELVAPTLTWQILPNPATVPPPRAVSLERTIWLLMRGNFFTFILLLIQSHVSSQVDLAALQLRLCLNFWRSCKHCPSLQHFHILVKCQEAFLSQPSLKVAALTSQKVGKEKILWHLPTFLVAWCKAADILLSFSL